MACVDSWGQGYALSVVDRDDAREAAITRDEAQAWFTRFLLRRVGRDEYPSTTQLDLIEKSIPRGLLDDEVPGGTGRQGRPRQVPQRPPAPPDPAPDRVPTANRTPTSATSCRTR